jgi:hypothetical protein
VLATSGVSIMPLLEVRPKRELGASLGET